MQVKLEKYNKWYNKQKNNNIADISILNVINEWNISKLYKVFNEIILNENVLFDFSSIHEFDNESIILENIETLIDYISNNNGKLDFIYKNDAFLLAGVAQLHKKEINENIFIKICSTFEGVTFYNTSSKFNYTDLKKLLKLNKKIYTNKYLVNKNLVNCTINFSNDGLGLYISFNSTYINADDLFDKIKLIMDND